MMHCLIVLLLLCCTCLPALASPTMQQELTFVGFSPERLRVLHLRGGGPKKKEEPVVKKAEGLEGFEIPEPEQPSGDRYEFWLHSQKLKEEYENGTREIDTPLLERKSASTVIEKRGKAPVEFLEKYRRANRSLNPYAQAATELKSIKK